MRAVCDAAQQRLQAIDVHRLGEHVFHDFVHQRMVGNLDVAFDVFLAGGHVGEDRSQQIVGAHALNLRRNFLAALEAQQGQSAVRVPAPARAEDGRSQRRLLQNSVARFRRCRKWKTSASGKLCCSASAMLRPLSVAAACNSKLKLRQNRLRSASPQALLMRPPKGAWITNCIPPPSSKKRSAMMVSCVGTVPQHRAALQDVLDRLLGAGIIQSAFFLQPCNRFCDGGLCWAKFRREKYRAGDR